MSVTRGRFTGRGVEVSLDPQRVVCERGVMFQPGLCSVEAENGLWKRRHFSARVVQRGR